MAVLRPRFSRRAIIAGVRASLPLQIALAPFGLVCGIIAEGHGLSLAEALLMSAVCYAGSAQLLALSHWGVPAPVMAATMAAFVVNLRMALMGPVIAPWLDRIRGWRLFATLFVMADQNWAMSVRELQAGRWDAGYLFGSGLVMWVVWVATTGAGHVMGTSMRPPPGHPLFFAALAVFVAIARRDLARTPRHPAMGRRWCGVPRSLPRHGWDVVYRCRGDCRRDGWRLSGSSIVTFDPWVLVTIFCMALATYATRAGGYFVFRALRPPQIVRDMLAYVPGALFVSYVVPALAAGGMQQWIGAASTLAIMLATRQMAVAIMGGTAAAWATWILT